MYSFEFTVVVGGVASEKRKKAEGEGVKRKRNRR